MDVARSATTVATGLTNREGAPLSLDNEAIYQRIFEAIVEHRLPPGTQLKEDVLCEIFSVGRTRIRKALFRLANDHIVDLYPHRGAFVAHPSVEVAREVFRARRVIESHLVRSVAHAVDKSVHKALHEHLRCEQAARRRGDQSTTIRLCGRFHLVLADLANSPIMGGFLRELVSRTTLVVAIYQSQRLPSCEMDEHGALVRAVAAGRADEAADLMVSHLNGIEGRLDLRRPEERPTDLREALGGGEPGPDRPRRDPHTGAPRDRPGYQSLEQGG